MGIFFIRSLFFTFILYFVVILVLAFLQYVYVFTAAATKYETLKYRK